MGEGGFRADLLTAMRQCPSKKATSIRNGIILIISKEHTRRRLLLRSDYLLRALEYYMALAVTTRSNT